MLRVVNSDCEGPISKNDNAFEAMAHFVPDGDKIFARISKVDDVFADNLKIKLPDGTQYDAGSTLRLIVPFMKAAGVTDKLLEDFSAQKILMIQNSEDTIRHIKAISNMFIISTSYEQYIKPLCKILKFPYENTYCTKVSLDKYSMTERERYEIRDFGKEIAQMPMIEIPSGAKSIEDFAKKDQELINRFNEILWGSLANMSCGKAFSEVVTIGGSQKAAAVTDVTEKLHIALEDAMYVGDSITDVDAFQLVNKNKGFTLSFNGNAYAVINAQVATLSNSNLITAILADSFAKWGTNEALYLASNLTVSTIEERLRPLPILDTIKDVYRGGLPKVELVTDANREALGKESSAYRKQVRGVVGRLG